MRDLVAGERADIPDTIALAPSERIEAPLGLALIALGADRKAAPALPPIDTVTRELRPAAAFEEGGALSIRLAEMPESVERLMLIAFEAADQPLRRTLGVATADVRYSVDLRDRADAALILIELYRYRGGWRLSANGQGFSSGLAALAASVGLDPAWVARLSRRRAPPQDDARPDHRDRSGGASGSAVAVDPHHVLTNAHVIEGAEKAGIVLAGRQLPADVVFADVRNDLALLRVDTPIPAVARFRAGLELHLGEDLVVLGFPLQGLLGSGPQASAGNVAALCGVGNDSTVFQFTAPIASGNSGGPIVDLSGQVIGLVSSSLNLERLRSSGANAENVNFGIKGAVARSFLDAFGLQPQLAAAEAPLGRAEVVRRMRDAIVKVTVSW